MVSTKKAGVISPSKFSKLTHQLSITGRPIHKEEAPGSVIKIYKDRENMDKVIGGPDNSGEREMNQERLVSKPLFFLTL